MKAFGLTLIFATASLFSMPMGNPASPQIIEKGVTSDGDFWLGARLGYMHDEVIDRSVDTVDRYRSGIEEFSSSGDYGILNFTFIDRIGLYGVIGAEHFKLVHNPIATQQDIYRTANHFSWTLGGRAVLFNFSKTVVGLDVQYHSCKPQISSITSNGNAVRPLSISRINYRQWQVGLGVTHQMDFFYPYFGVCFSNLIADLKHLPPGYLPAENYFKIRSHSKFGLSFGATISTGQYFMLSIEGRVIDEQEINVSWSMRF